MNDNIKDNREINFEDLKSDNNLKSIFPDYCEWIREIVPEFKLNETKKFLTRYDNYFDPDSHGNVMVERVYRGIKNSIKVEYSYHESITFLSYLIYLFSDNEKPDRKNIERDLLKITGKNSFLFKFYKHTKDSKKNIEKKGFYYLCDRVTLTYLGSSVMFYYILISIIDVIEKALKDKEYKLEGILDWKEGISLYVISEIGNKDLGIDRKKIIEDIEKEIKKE